MIATGVGYGVSGAFGYDLPTEIIDLTKPRLECKLDNDDGTLNKISKREYSVGGLISNNPIICGATNPAVIILGLVIMLKQNP